MIQFHIGVDGGGTGTRVRLARADGVELAEGRGGPSGLSHGIANAWGNIDTAVAQAFAAAGIDRPPFAAMALGAGLAGVHNKLWAAEFEHANPGYARLRVATDSFTTLLGAHDGQPGAIVALGTGSVGAALLADGRQIEVGGWGFPAGDEASGGWLGLKAAGHAQQAVDGRQPHSAFAQAVIDAMGGGRDAMQAWLGKANQTIFASLAPLVLEHAGTSEVAGCLLREAGAQAALIAQALDPAGTLPLALCGGLGEPLRPYLPADVRARCQGPRGDAARGALRLVQMHLKG
jgi:glucosamine kinase